MLYKIFVEQLINYRWTVRIYIIKAPNNVLAGEYLHKKYPFYIFGDMDVVPYRKLKKIKKGYRRW